MGPGGWGWGWRRSGKCKGVCCAYHGLFRHQPRGCCFHLVLAFGRASPRCIPHGNIHESDTLMVQWG